ncbi:uncharacterized protein LOC126839485 [Adelges cooleyi]|uniref:uncharacterized protein LOC126839485 n=1 Tax=Adelges cooleyi TaxID=133065 RepID=UPI00218000C8|nr:uncharacterized protein LOC126839485 [Adelges cooleyi]
MMYCKVYFIVLLFVFFQTNCMACENLEEIDKFDLINSIRAEHGWREIKGIVIKDPIEGKITIEDLTGKFIWENNYDKAVEHFILFLSCRYVQHLKALRITWLGFVEGCREEEEKISFTFCVSKLYCVFRESKQMLIHMTDGLVDLEKLSSNTSRFYHKNRSLIMNFKEVVFDHINQYPNPDFMNKDDEINEQFTEDVYQSISDKVRQRLNVWDNERDKGCTIQTSSMTYFDFLERYDKLLDKSAFSNDEYVYVSKRLYGFYDNVIENDYFRLGLDKLKKYKIK